MCCVCDVHVACVLLALWRFVFGGCGIIVWSCGVTLWSCWSLVFLVSGALWNIGALGLWNQTVSGVVLVS